MAYRWHPKQAEVDPDNPQAWGTCDRCGFVRNLKDLVWQYSYMGAFQPMNMRILVCPDRCLDELNPQDQAYILPPDPAPIFNARPEPYLLDETSWLVTQDGEIIATEADSPFITAIPNPDSTQGIQDQAAVPLATEDDIIIVTEAGEGNSLDYEPNE